MKLKHKPELHINTLISLSIALMASISAILVGVFISIGYSREIKENAIQTTREISFQVNNNLNHYISDIMNVASYANHVALSIGDLTLETIEDRLQTLIESRDDIQRIALFDLDGDIIATTRPEITLNSNKIIEENWFLKAKDEEGEYFFTGPRIQTLSDESLNELVLSYSTVITFIDEYSDRSTKAILLINLNFNALSDIIDKAKLPGSGYFYIINENGVLIYRPNVDNPDLENQPLEENNDQNYYFSKVNGIERLTFVEPIDLTTWNLIGVSLLDEVMRPVQTFKYIIILIIGFALLLTVIIGRIVSKFLTSPIYKLEEAMRKVQKGNFDISVPMAGTVETKSLSASFSITIEKIRELMDGIMRSEKIKRQREIEALQAKINPHFLYNTLDSMIWMAETGDKEGVVKMATSLATLFRISIAKGHDIITLQEELEHVESYLKIQQMRYKDKFSYSINLPEELKNVPTTKLLIQPIVENSIYHGIKYLSEPGKIEINIIEKNNKIIISIKDNGIGMKKDKLDNLLSLNSETNNDTSSSSNGIGLKNIDERIKLIYGVNYGLRVYSIIDEGTNVIITIPKGEEIKPVVLKK